MAGKCQKVPWWEDFSEKDLNEWYSEDPEAAEDYIKQRAQQWKEIEAWLRPGQPHPMAFPLAEDDPQYKIELDIWKHEVAQENVLARHRPIPQIPPQDPDFLGLASKDKEDRQTASEIIRHRGVIQDQIEKANQLQAIGEVERARECRERAVYFNRTVEDLRKKRPYTYQVEQEKRDIDRGTQELEEAMTISPEELQQRLDHFSGLCSAFNATHTGEFSYVINSTSGYDQGRDGTLKVLKIDHPGHRSCDLKMSAEARNMSELDRILNAGYGKEGPKRKEEVEEVEGEPEAQEKQNDDLESMSQAEFEKAREDSGARKF